MAIRYRWYRKSSDVIQDTFKMKIAAFFLGIYNPRAVEELKAQILAFKPDIIQVQNVYPFISAAILPMIKRLNIPVVMRCPNYRLFCPTGLHLEPKGKVCEKCLKGSREFNAILKNCENKLVQIYRLCSYEISRLENYGNSLKTWMLISYNLVFKSKNS